MSAIRVFLMYITIVNFAGTCMKTRPLFGISPLFGVSVIREFTVIQCDAEHQWGEPERAPGCSTALFTALQKSGISL